MGATASAFKRKKTKKKIAVNPHGKTVDQIASCVKDLFSGQAIGSWLEQNRLLAYQDDPVGFCENELHETLTDDVKSMMNSVRDNVWTIAKSANATGKSYAAAAVAVWFWKCHPGAQVYIAAAPPENNLRMILWSKINEKRLKNPKLFETDIISDLQLSKANITPSDSKVVTANLRDKTDSFIAGVTIPTQGAEATREAKFSGKHSPFLLFVLDEGDAIPDEVYKGIEGCISGGHARVLVMFNPRRQAGRAYHMIVQGTANVVEMSAFNHPNVITGRDILPGAVTREITVKRINDGTLPLMPDEEPDENCFEVPPFLVGAVVLDSRGDPYEPLPAGWRRVRDDHNEFFYMVLGRYPAKGSNQLISSVWIREARARWDVWTTVHGIKPPDGIRPIFGHDVADIGNDHNVLCKRYGGYVAPFISWRGVDPDEAADRCADIAKSDRPIYVNVDSIGVGAAVPALLRKQGIRANRVMVSESPTKGAELDKGLKSGVIKCMFGKLRDQLWWEIREWLRCDPSAMLPPDDRLLEELALPTYEEDQGRIKIMSKPKMRDSLKRSPDTADALALTFAPPNKIPRIRLI